MDMNIERITLTGRQYILLGTAHISRESVQDVRKVINDEKPDLVCIEIDKARYISLTSEDAWKKLNIIQVLKERKGFLLLANLILASFQRRLGLDLRIRPGAEMLEAINVSKELGIPFSLCDRDIQITLKRAWAKTRFFGKLKMLAVMLASMLSSETLSEEKIEELKSKGALQGMMEELAHFLPRVKEVLIDERDIFIAAGIYRAEGKKVLAVVGAGHVAGILVRLKKLHTGTLSDDVSSFLSIPRKSTVARGFPWIVPAAIVSAIIASAFLRGSDVTITNLLRWIILNGSLAAAGALISLAHPLTVVLAFIAAPITSLIPVVGVGLFTGILEAVLRKPRVLDFENLLDDIVSLKGFFRNRLTHVLIVFLLTNVGSTIGTFAAGIPIFASLFK
ncbi:MAG: conjugal transfer protein TraB [Spirochaetes bacterium DG_61]|nr:MAG: conjugal transfer protein TraB [Spirochaetes bacterium DG_61]